MMETMSTDIRTEFALRWEDGTIRGPVTEEFARDALRDPDLSVVLLTRVVLVGEWVEG